MSKIVRGRIKCTNCDRSVVRVKKGRRVKAKGYHRERCLVCGYYIKK